MVASVGPVAQSPLAMGSWQCKRVEEVAHRPKRESSTHTPTHDECSGSSPLCAELRFNGHCAPREWCKCGEVGRCTLVPGVCLRLSQKCVGDGARGVLAMACPSSATPTPTSTLHPTRLTRSSSAPPPPTHARQGGARLSLGCGTLRKGEGGGCASFDVPSTPRSHSYP